MVEQEVGTKRKELHVLLLCENPHTGLELDSLESPGAFRLTKWRSLGSLPQGKFDLVVLLLRSSRQVEPEQLQALQARFPLGRCVFMMPEAYPVPTIQALLALGAGGYTRNDAPPEVLSPILQTVAHGGRALDPWASSLAARPGPARWPRAWANRPRELSAGQWTCFLLAGEGYSDADIACRLGMTVAKSASNRVKEACKILGLGSREEIASCLDKYERRLCPAWYMEFEDGTVWSYVWEPVAYPVKGPRATAAEAAGVVEDPVLLRLKAEDQGLQGARRLSSPVTDVVEGAPTPI